MMDTQQGGILGIKNRTENWKTAKTFAPFMGDSEVAAQRRLTFARRLGEQDSTSAGAVELQLFWYGIRDALLDGERKYTPERAAEWAKSFDEACVGLREKIESWNKKQPNQTRRLNGIGTDKYLATSTEKLYKNLLNTEFDIVLEVGDNLFIGEAKHLSDLNANGNRALVHQLIRQYVAAKVLCYKRGIKRNIVPFIVCDYDKEGRHGINRIREKAQVRFMVDQGWLYPGNILSWTAVKAIANCSANQGR